MKRVAPERIAQLDELLSLYKVVFETDQESNTIKFSATPSENKITVGVRGVDRLWAYAFAYLGIYERLAERRNADPKIRVIDFTTDTDLKPAIDLLTWATAEDIQAAYAHFMKDTRQPLELPSGVPMPFDPGGTTNQHKMASDLALMALGFILFHELAHLVLKHEPTEGLPSILDEKEADFWAASWMVDIDGIDGLVRKKRLLGVSLGLTWLTLFEIYLGPKQSLTHPASYDRLFQVLDRLMDSRDQSTEGEDNWVWSWVQVQLLLHLRNRGVPLDESMTFDTFKDCVNYYLDVISRL